MCLFDVSNGQKITTCGCTFFGSLQFGYTLQYSERDNLSRYS